MCTFQVKLKQKTKPNHFLGYRDKHIYHFRGEHQNHFEILNFIDTRKPEELWNEPKEFIKNECGMKMPKMMKEKKANWI